MRPYLASNQMGVVPHDRTDNLHDSRHGLSNSYRLPSHGNQSDESPQIPIVAIPAEIRFDSRCSDKRQMMVGVGGISRQGEERSKENSSVGRYGESTGTRPEQLRSSDGTLQSRDLRTAQHSLPGALPLRPRVRSQ